MLPRIFLTVAARAEDAVLASRFGMASRFAGTAYTCCRDRDARVQESARRAGFRCLAGSHLRLVAVINIRSISTRFKHALLTTANSQGAHGREREFWRGNCCAPLK